MSKRTRNRVLLVAGFLVCLAIVVTVITLIIVGICKAVSGGNADQTGEIAQVQVIYDTSSATSSTASDTSSDTSSEDGDDNDDDTSSEDGDDTSSDSEDTSSAASSDTTASSTTAKSPEDFVADFASNAA